MAVTLNEDGQIVITLDRGGLEAVEELKMRRRAIYDAIEYAGKDNLPVDSDKLYGLVALLKDTEPDEKQLNKMFN